MMVKVLFFVLNMSFMSLLCVYVLADSEAFSCRGNITPQEKQKIFYREDQAEQTNIELRWRVAEAKQGQRRTRAMWEESEAVLLFARIKPKHFLY